MSKTVLLIGTLDTKGAEYGYVRNLIIERGHRVLILDAGIMGKPSFPPDINAEAVAQAGGTNLAALRQQANRGIAVEVMARGAAKLATQLYAESKFDGVLGLGGAGGTTIATAAMRTLPLGVPKVMVSTLAYGGDIQSYVGVKDINMMYSVVDIAGINRLSRPIFANAVGSVCGMVEQKIPSVEEKPLLAATMFGVTTPCVDVLRERMEQAGYEVVVFHATGRGGQSMEELVKDGLISGVADVTTSEWCDELVGGVMSAGPHRLEAAGKAGIPQVVSCGALDIVDFYHNIPSKFRGRTLYKHNANITLMRTSPEECAQLGRIIAGKLNRAKGPTALFVPLQGLSAMDKKGQPFYWPEANEALFEALRRNVRPPVELIEMDLHINDPEFAIAMADCLLEMLKAQTG